MDVTEDATSTPPENRSPLLARPTAGAPVLCCNCVKSEHAGLPVSVEEQLVFPAKLQCSLLYFTLGKTAGTQEGTPLFTIKEKLRSNLILAYKFVRF